MNSGVILTSKYSFCQASYKRGNIALEQTIPLFFLLFMRYSSAYAQVVKLVDTPALGAGAARHGGSSPLLGTNNI